MSVKYLRYKDLEDRKIINNRTTLHRWIASGYFPKPIKLGTKNIAWREDVIEAWLKEREAA